MRKRYGKIRYLHCGEYGETSGRPHHHMIIFGFSPPDQWLWRTKDGNNYYRSEILDSLWMEKGESLGFAELAPVTFGSASYVAGYTAKKLKKADWLKENAYYGQSADAMHVRKQDYLTASTVPPLGQTFIEKYWPEIYPADQVWIDGKQYKPPASYDRWMQKNQPEVFRQTTESRVDSMADLMQDGPTSENALKARFSNSHFWDSISKRTAI